MHGKREADVWFVFRILECGLNFGDFIRVTCNRGADKPLARPGMKQAAPVKSLMGRGMG